MPLNRRSLLRAFARRVLVAFAIVSTLAAGSVVAVNLGIDAKLGGIRRVDVKVHVAPMTAPQNYLLVGSDSRSFVKSSQDASQFGSASSQSGQRSDTIMIVRVDPRTHHALLLSVPRDLWVPIPGLGHQKINAAYNAGVQTMVQTIEQTFGLQINHYLEVNFESFRGIVNAVGGVQVTFDAPTYDVCTGLHIHAAGTYRLNGEDALAYVRSRHYEVVRNGRWQPADAIPDLGRIKRQQAFMREVASEAVKKSLNSPTRALHVVDALLPKLRADRQFGRAQIFQLLSVFEHVDPSDARSIEMLTLDTQGGPRQRGADVLYLAPSAATQLGRLRGETVAATSQATPRSQAATTTTPTVTPPSATTTTTVTPSSQSGARSSATSPEPPLPKAKCT